MDGSPRPSPATLKGAVRKSSTNTSTGTSPQDGGSEQTRGETGVRTRAGQPHPQGVIKEDKKPTGQQVVLKRKQVQQNRGKPSVGAPGDGGGGGGVAGGKDSDRNEEGRSMKEVVVHVVYRGVVKHNTHIINEGQVYRSFKWV